MRPMRASLCRYLPQCPEQHADQGAAAEDRGEQFRFRRHVHRQIEADDGAANDARVDQHGTFQQ